MSDTTAHAPAWDSLPSEPGGDDELNLSGFVDEFQEVPRPINWDLLSPDDLEAAWLDLNTWVNWLRHTYGLPATVIPPYWHRHAELVWELSALHTHWQGAYHPDQHASAPAGWHRDFADTRERLRDWTATSGTRLDHDQPTRQTLWPGELPQRVAEVPVLPDRNADFHRYLAERSQTIARRKQC